MNAANNKRLANHIKINNNVLWFSILEGLGYNEPILHNIRLLKYESLQAVD